ncbi:multicopper oxidase family protein [Nonomuraea spiralis]|uniref:Multicopper oxidase family protein n=1 Tax=Nonomuraea spiralis TaxID=46182 RepID=A0ABV5IGP6_9ACTN|nr:multicopper oxidase family protein [Nonomuraea spiralis]GGS98202.1 sugar transporter [Nonomuraea spiralis]
MEDSRGVVTRRLFVSGMFAAIGSVPAVAAAASEGGGTTAAPGGRVLRASPGTVVLDGRALQTWAYDGLLPGPTIRATAGGTVRARLVNDLPEATTVHWHGIRIAHAMDGAPGFSQRATQPGDTFDYVFTVPDAGTYFYHSHVGMQSDRGLYGPLIVEDPDEPHSYDHEFTVMLDDWLDGVNGNADDALRKMNTTPHDVTLTSHVLGGTSGHVRYPYYLVNGRTADDPMTYTASPGNRVRFRVINAAADTAFRVSLGGHRMTVTHADGFPCEPVTVDTFVVGMGERYDFLVTLEAGAFPLMAMAEGKAGRAFAVVRTAPGARTPSPNGQVPELQRRTLSYQDLRSLRADRLPPPSRTVTVTLGWRQRVGGNEWTLNGRLANDPMRLRVDQGETIRIVMHNDTHMWHPMHLHGHTFQVLTSGGRGPRKDTVNVMPRKRLKIDVHADNPGEWMFHCHNLYHQEQGMMGVFGYGKAPRRRHDMHH